MDLLTEEEARQRIKALIDSREWWVIPWCSDRASDLSRAIEERYYDGAASADFSLMLLPPRVGAFAVGFAHKRRMTPAQLWRVYRDAAVTTGMKRAEFVEAVKTQDVLVAADGPATEDHDTMTRLLVWQEWVLGRLPKGVG